MSYPLTSPILILILILILIPIPIVVVVTVTVTTIAITIAIAIATVVIATVITIATAQNDDGNFNILRFSVLQQTYLHIPAGTLTCILGPTGCAMQSAWLKSC